MSNLTLLSVQSLQEKSTITVVDQFLGYAHKMPSSVNLFLHVSDLLDPSIPTVKFMTITLPGEGSKEHVLTWGIYEKHTNKFIIDEGCNYENYAKLNSIIANWKQHGYQSAMSTKENKISKTLGQYTSNVSFINSMFGGTSLIPDENTYRAVLYFIAYTLGDITYDELTLIDYEPSINKLAKTLYRKSVRDLSDLELLDFIDDLKMYKTKYEEGLNVTSVVKTMNNILGPYINKINKAFQDTYAKSAFYYERNVQTCPSIEYCRENEDALLCSYVKYVTERELLQ